MIKSQYEFWDPLELPLLFVGSILVPSIFFVINFLITRQVRKKSAWLLWSLSIALISLCVTSLLGVVWLGEIMMPIADYDHNDPMDLLGDNHQAANLFAGLLMLGCTFGSNFCIFGLGLVFSWPSRFSGKPSLTDDPQ